MSFQQGLSGLNASSQNLDVIGHNIANANTTGMKASRAEFAELYASSLGSSGGISSGIGVEVSTVSQQFTQGNISVTGNSLDVAINGNGFFQVKQPNDSIAYSRDGAFKLNDVGDIITNSGAHLLGISAAADGSIPSGGSVGALTLPKGGQIPAVATGSTTGVNSGVTLDFNLYAGADIAVGGPPPTALVPVLETYGTSITAYNAQGTEIPVSVYFTKAAANTWNVYATVDGGAVTPQGSLQYGADGALLAATPSSGVGTGLDPLTLPTATGGTVTATLNADNSTQYGSKFSVAAVTQDGQAPGTLTAIAIDASGVIQGTYSNGKSIAAGQIQLATFTNVQGLAPIGGNYWRSTQSSGEPSAKGAPGSGNLGSLRAGALEDSNVDLTKELVNMMTAQRAYQANAQTIKTQDQVMSTLVNLR